MSEEGLGRVDLSEIIKLAKDVLSSMLPASASIVIGKNKDIVTGTYTLRDFIVTITVREHKTI